MIHNFINWLFDKLDPSSPNFFLNDIFDTIKFILDCLDTISEYINPFSDKFILKKLGEFLSPVLQPIVDFLSNILSYINPLDENFILKPVLDFLGSVIDYLNPFSEKFILKRLWDFLTTLVDYLNPFSENFILKSVVDWVVNFFTALWDFFVHIFIPTDEQWSEIKNDYASLGNAVKSHVPFVGLFSEELKKAQDTVSKTDFLVFNLPSFKYSGSGGIGVNSAEVKVVNVGQAYEPYRAYIRGFLLLVVVGLAFVYIVRYVLNYGVTSVSSNKDNSGGGSS